MINALTAAACPPLPNSPVVLMVSGGSDSTALLVRAARGVLDLADGRGPAPVGRGRLHVLHVNHCLRGAAADADEAFVRDLCGRLGVPCAVRRVDVARLAAGDGGNVEEVAREVRYAAAWELAGELARAAGVPRETARIAVAHTADDRAETFVMRMLTGAGAAGFTGLRRLRGVVVRPLLGETRAGLRAYLGAEGVGWCEDATNAEDAALRSYVRNRVVPPLAARNPSFSRTLGASLDVLGDESDYLDGLARRELAAVRLPARAGELALDAAGLAGLHPALARRALRLGLADLLGAEGFRAARFEARHVEALRGLAARGAGSCTLPLGMDARVDRGALVVRTPAGAAPPADAELPVPGALAWGDCVLTARLVELPADCADPVAWCRSHARALAASGLAEGRDFVLADAGSVGPGPALQVGSPRAGERLFPFGMPGSKLVSDLLRDAGVPLRDRPWVPVVRGRYASGGPDSRPGCVWVGGFRLDGRAAYGPATRGLVELHVTRDARAPEPPGRADPASQRA